MVKQKRTLRKNALISTAFRMAADEGIISSRSMTLVMSINVLEQNGVHRLIDLERLDENTLWNFRNWGLIQMEALRIVAKRFNVKLVPFRGY